MYLLQSDELACLPVPAFEDLILLVGFEYTG